MRADSNPRAAPIIRRVTDRRVLAEGRFLRFVEEDGWEFVERQGVTGIAVVLAVTAQDRLLLVEQYRPAVRAQVIELPAGLAGDVPGHEAEDLSVAARRELLEETGYEADEMTPLAAGPPSVGVTSELVTLFRASGLRRTGPGGGCGSEDIRLHEVPVADADGWLLAQARAGRLVDPKVWFGLYFLAPHSPAGSPPDRSRA
jgi:ADP-ribose pyrophosphatase